MHSFLGVPIRVREEVFGNLYMTEKRGRRPVRRGRRGSAHRAGRGRRRGDRQRPPLRRGPPASRVAGGDQRAHPRPAVRPDRSTRCCAGFARRVGAIAQADLAVVALPDAEGEDLLVVAAEGIGRAADARRAVADRGVAARFGVPGRADGAGRRRSRPTGAPQVEVAPQAPLGPVILVPLGGPGQVRGVLSVTRADGRRPSSTRPSAQLVADLAVQAAVVLELAERRRDGELLSLYADRDRIGRDLHDLAIQRLFATSMSLAGRVQDHPEAGRGQADRAGDHRPRRHDQGHPLDDLRPALPRTGARRCAPSRAGAGDRGLRKGGRTARLHSVGAIRRPGRHADLGRTSPTS